MGFLNFLSSRLFPAALLLACLSAHSLHAAKLYCDPQIRQNAAAERKAGIDKDINRFVESYTKPDNIEDMFCGNNFDKAFETAGTPLTIPYFKPIDNPSLADYVSNCENSSKNFINKTAANAQQQNQQQQDCNNSASVSLLNLFSKNKDMEKIYNYIKQFFSVGKTYCPTMDELTAALTRCANNLTAECVVAAVNAVNSGTTSTLVGPAPVTTTPPVNNGGKKDDEDNRCKYDVCVGDRI